MIMMSRSFTYFWLAVEFVIIMNSLYCYLCKVMIEEKHSVPMVLLVRLLSSNWWSKGRTSADLCGQTP